MDKICKIWDDELTSILDIEKIGHRKRILLSVAGKHGIENRFGKVRNTNFHYNFYGFLLASNHVRNICE